MKQITVYENGQNYRWYSIEPGERTIGSRNLEYEEKDVEKLLETEGEWDICRILRRLVTIQIHREGRDDIRRRLLNT